MSQVLSLSCLLTSLQVLSSEREKHAASETELNMKNLGLADKLKEARGEVTGMWHIFLISSFSQLVPSENFVMARLSNLLKRLEYSSFSFE